MHAHFSNGGNRLLCGPTLHLFFKDDNDNTFISLLFLHSNQLRGRDVTRDCRSTRLPAYFQGKMPISSQLSVGLSNGMRLLLGVLM